MLSHSMLGFLIKMTRLQQRLTRDTANPKASATELLVFIDADHLHLQLGSSDRSHITCGSTTKHYQIDFPKTHLKFRLLKIGSFAVPSPARWNVFSCGNRSHFILMPKFGKRGHGTQEDPGSLARSLGTQGSDEMQGFLPTVQ
jgi:hypothetical protein